MKEIDMAVITWRVVTIVTTLQVITAISISLIHPINFFKNQIHFRIYFRTTFRVVFEQL